MFKNIFHFFSFFLFASELYRSIFEIKEAKKTGGKFHQHFMCSFYACRSQKCKKDSQLKQLFALLGSVGVKAAYKHVDEIDPRLRPSWSWTHKEKVNHLKNLKVTFLTILK